MVRFFSFILLLMTYCSLAAQIPNVQVDNYKGESYNTSDLLKMNKPMIISFWSTMCKPCIRELDAINEVIPDWLEEADFKVIAVSVDDMRSSSKARSLVQGHGWNDFVILYDKNQLFMRAMNVSLTPQVFVVDKSGKIVYSHTGYTVGSEEKLFEVIKSLK